MRQFGGEHFFQVLVRHCWHELGILYCEYIGVSDCVGYVSDRQLKRNVSTLLIIIVMHRMMKWSLRTVLLFSQQSTRHIPCHCCSDWCTFVFLFGFVMVAIDSRQWTTGFNVLRKTSITWFCVYLKHSLALSICCWLSVESHCIKYGLLYRLLLRHRSTISPLLLISSLDECCSIHQFKPYRSIRHIQCKCG